MTITTTIRSALLTTGLLAAASVSNAYTVTGSSGNLAASAAVTVVGGNLQIVLTNTSNVDVDDPPDILTALFFDCVGCGTLTPVSALLANGSTVFFGSDGGGNVGGEWAYGEGLSGAPSGATEGISSSGFGLFGGANFNGANLQNPAAVDGLQYGITSAGDNTATGNAAVTGGNALIKNAVTFTLSSSVDLTNFLLDKNSFTKVSFQYGTALDEPNVPGDDSGCCQVPEPGSLALLGLGLAGLGAVRRRRA